MHRRARANLDQNGQFGEGKGSCPLEVEKDDTGVLAAWLLAARVRSGGEQDGARQKVVQEAVRTAARIIMPID